DQKAVKMRVAKRKKGSKKAALEKDTNNEDGHSHPRKRVKRPALSNEESEERPTPNGKAPRKSKRIAGKSTSDPEDEEIEENLHVSEMPSKGKSKQRTPTKE